MNEQEKLVYFDKLNNQFHATGRILLALAYIMMFAAPIAFGLLMGGTADGQAFLSGFLNVAIVFFPMAIVEFLVYTPMMGVGGSYVGFLTGNLTTVKIPCIMNAREIAKTKAGSPEEEVVTTLSVATCALTSIVVIFIGVMIFLPFAHILEDPFLAPAFENVVAALFGALGLKYFIKQPKIAAIPLFTMTLLCILVPMMIDQTSVLLIPAGLMAMGIGMWLAKKGKIKVDG